MALEGLVMTVELEAIPALKSAVVVTVLATAGAALLDKEDAATLATESETSGLFELLAFVEPLSPVGEVRVFPKTFVTEVVTLAFAMGTVAGGSKTGSTTGPEEAKVIVPGTVTAFALRA